MIVAGQLLLTDRPQHARLEQGWLRVAAGRIAELGLGPCPHTPDLGGDHALISPGFIDTHVHLPQFDSIGCDGLPLLEWLATNIFPREARWADVDYAAAMVERVFDQFISHGTTSFCAYATVHYPATRVALRMAQQRNLRACIGQSLMDRESPPELTYPTRQLIDETQTLLGDFPPRGTSRVEAAVTPRFAVSCTPELMQAVGKLAQQHQTVVQTHLAETVPECQLVESMFPGQSYTAVYDSMGLLTPRTLLGHGIYLIPDERQLLIQRGSVVAHCPTANVFLQSGIMPRSTWQAEGVRLSLGTDIGAGYDVAMPRVARAMIDAAKYLRMSNPVISVPTASEAWYQFTAGNADAVGWPQVGRLTVGAEADILVLHPNIAWQAANDPLSMLLYAWDSRWIKQVLIAGQPVSMPA